MAHILLLTDADIMLCSLRRVCAGLDAECLAGILCESDQFPGDKVYQRSDAAGMPFSHA